VSDTTGKIYELLSKVMADVGAVGKNQTNRHQNYKFRGVDDVYNAVQPAMVKNGVFAVPEVLEQTCEVKQTTGGKPTNHTILKIRFTFFAPDGSSVAAVTIGESMDTGDKSSNQAMSAAFKYALFQTLCIPTEGDNDADAHTHELAGTTAPKTAKPKPTPKARPAPAGGSPDCPKCGGAMKQRAAKADGSLFWGCLSYPDCKGTAKIDAGGGEDTAGDDGLPPYPDGFGYDIPLPDTYKRGGELLGDVDNEHLEHMRDKGKGPCVKAATAELARRRHMGIRIAPPAEELDDSSIPF